MAKEKSLVEEAIIQMKNLEEAVAENAKGILASTMKEEIKELVKESLTEQEEEEIDTDVDMEEPEMEDDMSDEEGDEMDTDNLDMNVDAEPSDDEETIDLTGEDDEDEILRVFSLMGPEDNIVVTKDESGNINLKDSDKEYMIVGEGEDGEYSMDEFGEEFENEYEDDYEDDDSDEESIEDIVSKVFEQHNEDENEEYDMDYKEENENWSSEENEGDEMVYEIEFNDEEGMGAESYGSMDEYFFNDDEEEEEEEEHPHHSMRGHHFDDEDQEDEWEDEEDEEYIEEPVMGESKMSIKPKGVGMGSPKFKYNAKPNQGQGFKTKMKEGPKTMGTGKAKFEYKEGENLDGEAKPIKKSGAKKVETKEAARTMGNGSNFRKGGLPKPKAHSNANTAIKENVDAKELQVLREKNEEYRKALNVFRNKLNEVAVFNSNLAYATRLFTEHSTSKQEKINILRRFDSVETIKESKNLYKSIKDELSVTTSQPMNESIERKIENVPATGSAVTLIESKTYENPQFLRMKDLMSKLK